MPPRQRLTITRPVIAATKGIFVLAPSTKKAKVLAPVLTAPVAFRELPARLLVDAVWLIDTALPENVEVQPSRWTCPKS